MAQISHKCQQDAPKLVHLIASLAYASPTQLGYDPTATLRWSNEDWHYDIELTTQLPDNSQRIEIYKTVRVIYESANKFRGRASRVYEAIVDDSKDPSISHRVVLKDSWINVDRPKEGDTHAKIMEGAEPEEQELFTTLFQHGVVQINGMDDSTQDLILNGQTFFDSYQKEKPKRDKEIHPFFKHRLLWAKEIDKLSEDSSSAETSPPTVVCKTPLFHPYRQRSHNPFDVWPSSQPHVYSPKVHYRIAYKEVGRSLLTTGNCGALRTGMVHQVLHDVTLGKACSV